MTVTSEFLKTTKCG